MNNAVNVSELSEHSRNLFIRKTYFHLLMAIFAFVGLEVILFQSGVAYMILEAIQGLPWLAILGVFIGVSWIASRFAQSASSQHSQYFGLGLYVLAEAIIFIPLLAFAEQATGGGAIENAAVATILAFSGITAIAFGTKADFSWMNRILMIVGIGSLVAIICGSLFGFELGMWFSVAMVMFAGFSILHDTSNIIHHYSEDQYVAASLQLFASIAMMFWYLLRFFNSRD